MTKTTSSASARATGRRRRFADSRSAPQCPRNVCSDVQGPGRLAQDLRANFLVTMAVDELKRWPRARAYALAGLALAWGAPAGLLLMRVALGEVEPSVAGIEAEVVAGHAVYAYQLLSTSAVFGVLGVILGRKEDLLLRQSLTDHLTGLWNRRFFHVRLADELSRAQRYGTPLSLLLLDVDRLKEINDKLGHKGGDEALLSVAEALRSSLRTSDLAARFGGDEFAVLTPLTSADATAELAARIQKNLSRETAQRGLPPELTISMGVADLDSIEEPSEQALYQAADSVLYQAKQRGRNRSVRAPSRSSVPPLDGCMLAAGGR